MSRVGVKKPQRRKKTMPFVKIGEHNFTRYLMDDEYAAEMLCRACGFVICGSSTQREAEQNLKWLGGTKRCR